MESELDSGSSPGAEVGLKRSRKDMIDAKEEEGVDFFEDADSPKDEEGEGRLYGFAFLIY